MAVIALLIVLAFLATAAFVVVLRVRPDDRRGADAQVTDTSVTPPPPGEGPERAGERPIAGSRADRRRHGKP